MEPGKHIKVSHDEGGKQRAEPNQTETGIRGSVTPCTPHLAHLQNQPRSAAADGLRRYS